mgnify:CR=1 FL=1
MYNWSCNWSFLAAIKRRSSMVEGCNERPTWLEKVSKFSRSEVDAETQWRHEPNACVWKSETNELSTSANDMASSTQKRRSLGSFMMEDPPRLCNISTNTFTSSSLLVPAFSNISLSTVHGNVSVVKEEFLSMRMVLAARPIAASFILSPTLWSIMSFNICGGRTRETHVIYII